MTENYSALIAAWNLSSASSGALPNGVSGTSLFGLSTSAKITAINGWTVTGTIPSVITVTGAQVANCINYPEFKSLTDAQKDHILNLLQISGGLLSGSSELSQLLPGMLLDYFPVAGPTITALTALSTTLVQPWWQVSAGNGGGGLQGPVGSNDVIIAGLS